MLADKYKKEEIAEVDLHGLTVYDGEEKLLDVLQVLPQEVKLLVVTHGYSRGTALKKMVKEDFYHWRIKEKRVGLNPGATFFLLK